MHVHSLHAWDIMPSVALDLQKTLAQRVDYSTPLPLDTVRLVGGVDVSVKDNVSHAAVVVLSFPALHIVETVTAQMPTPFPYVPGLLSFREGPVLVRAFEQLQHTPDVFLFDGMGRIHPRRMGIASHMGLWLDMPTIGVGKTHLIGKYDEPDTTAGSYSPLTDKGEQLGVVLRTKQNVKPLFISPGHRIDLDSAIAIVLACTTKYRLPEPTRQAHMAAGKF